MKKHIMVLAVAALAVLAGTTESRAQIEPFTVASLTPSTNTIGTNAVATITTPAVAVRGEHGVGFVVKFKLGAAATNALTFHFNVSKDGTNWTTSRPFSASVGADGTNSVTHFFAFTPTGSPPLANVQWIRLAAVGNAATASGAAATIEELWSTRYNR